MLKGFRNKIRGYIPFTNWWLVERKMDTSRRGPWHVLDLGCGWGAPMLFLNRHKRFKTLGIDSHIPFLNQCTRNRSHTVVQRGDIRWYASQYPDGCFDIVMCLQTLEHLDRDDGEKLVKDMIRVARKQVIITTDVGEFVQSAYEDNPDLEHKYVWSVEELKAFGFCVYGMGVRGWGGETGISRNIPEPFRWFIGTTLQVALGWLMYLRPQWANAVLCVRNV